MSVLDWRIAQTPLAVVDVETTGINPGLDGIVEISVFRINPQSVKPELAFDSLINPRRPVGLTEVHGITQDDLADAPTFAAVAAMIIEAIAGAVLVAHNADFDLRFIRAEFHRLGVDFDVPYLCSMFLRPLLGLGPRCSLEHQCRLHGIQLGATQHLASADATATAFITFSQRRKMAERGLATFGDLVALGGHEYRFLSTLKKQPMSAGLAANFTAGGSPKSRADPSFVALYGTGSHVAVRKEDYFTALINVMSDVHVTDEEMASLQRIRESSELSEAQIRCAHARVYHWVLTNFIQDNLLDDNERVWLVKLHQCLRDLGWAPGD